MNEIKIDGLHLRREVIEKIVNDIDPVLREEVASMSKSQEDEAIYCAILALRRCGKCFDVGEFELDMDVISDMLEVLLCRNFILDLHLKTNSRYNRVKMRRAKWEAKRASASISYRNTQIAHLQEENERLKAELAKYQWYPIETAPKDDEIPLLMAAWIYGEKSVVIACWNSLHGDWNSEASLLYGREEKFDNFTPTHWMPLPSAPEEDEYGLIHGTRPKIRANREEEGEA